MTTDRSRFRDRTFRDGFAEGHDKGYEMGRRHARHRTEREVEAAKAAAVSMQKAIIGLAPDVEKQTQQDIDRVRAHIRDALGHLALVEGGRG